MQGHKQTAFCTLLSRGMSLLAVPAQHSVLVGHQRGVVIGDCLLSILLIRILVLPLRSSLQRSDAWQRLLPASRLNISTQRAIPSLRGASWSQPVRIYLSVSSVSLLDYWLSSGFSYILHFALTAWICQAAQVVWGKAGICRRSISFETWTNCVQKMQKTQLDSLFMPSFSVVAACHVLSAWRCACLRRGWCKSLSWPLAAKMVWTQSKIVYDIIGQVMKEGTPRRDKKQEPKKQEEAALQVPHVMLDQCHSGVRMHSYSTSASSSSGFVSSEAKQNMKHIDAIDAYTSHTQVRHQWNRAP